MPPRAEERTQWLVDKVLATDVKHRVFLLAYAAVYDPQNPTVIKHEPQTSWLRFEALRPEIRGAWLGPNRGMTLRGVPFMRTTAQTTISAYNEATKKYSVHLSGGARITYLKCNQFSAPDALQAFWNGQLGITDWGRLSELDLNVEYADQYGFTEEEAEAMAEDSEDEA